MLEYFESTLRLSIPLIFAAMGGLLCERSGIATICLEGVMLLSAFVAAAVNYHSSSPLLGTLAGMGTGALVMSFHAFCSISLKANQIVSGVATNLLASGLSPILCKAFFTTSSNTPSIAIENRFTPLPLPFFSKIPLLGKLFFIHMPLIYLALTLPFILHWILYKTGAGLRILASGDGPEALRAQGISPQKLRYLVLFFGGMITSLGGIYLSTSHASQFSREMTSGRGFIALAAVIFGKWKPFPVFVACLFFGSAEALQIQLQSSSFMETIFPVQFIQLIPYLVTLLVLIGKGKVPSYFQ